MDVISDMFSRIKTAILRKKDYVDIPHSKLKERILSLLQEEGYINSYEILEIENFKKGNQPTIRVHLKYLDNKKRKNAIESLVRVSKPGRKIYKGVRKIPHIQRGLGIAILSTDSGIISDKKARELGKGGEIIGYVY